MILEYNYDKGNKILEYFKQSKIATLDIKTVKENNETKFVMEYTLIEEYPEARQALIKEVLADSLPQRLQLTNVLNQFIENQTLNNVNEFSLKFNAVKVRKCEITYFSSYKQAPKNLNLVEELVNCLERFDRIIVEMGASDQAAINIYKREGSGRNKKYVPLTIKNIADTLRQSLMEE